MDVIHSIDEAGRKRGCSVGGSCNKCNFYRPTYTTGKDGTTVQKFDCQGNNLILLFGELNQRLLALQHVFESTRNEGVKRQDKFNDIFEAGSKMAQAKIDQAIEAQKKIDHEDQKRLG